MYTLRHLRSGYPGSLNITNSPGYVNRRCQVMKYPGECLDVRVESGRGSKGIGLTVSRELHNLYCLPNINWLGEEKMRWVGRTVRQGEKMSVCEVLSTNLTERKIRSMQHAVEAQVMFMCTVYCNCTKKRVCSLV